MRSGPHRNAFRTIKRDTFCETETATLIPQNPKPLSYLPVRRCNVETGNTDFHANYISAHEIDLGKGGYTPCALAQSWATDLWILTQGRNKLLSYLIHHCVFCLSQASLKLTISRPLFHHNYRL